MLWIIRSAFYQDTIAYRLLAGSSPLRRTFNQLEVGPWPSQGMPQRGRRHMDGMASECLWTIGSSASGTSGVGHFVEARYGSTGKQSCWPAGRKSHPR